MTMNTLMGHNCADKDEIRAEQCVHYLFQRTIWPQEESAN